MLQPINMLSLLENDCITCIYYETKELHQLPMYMPLIETQQ